MEHRKGEIGNCHPKALHRKQEQRPSEQSVRQRMNHSSRSETIACAWVNRIDSLCKMEVNFISKFRSVAMLTMAAMSVLRSLCCSCMRNNAATRPNTQSKNEELEKAGKEASGII